MNEVEFLEGLGRRLATLRRQAGLTQRALGFRAALSESQIYRIESGARRTRRSTLERVAEALANTCPALGPASELGQTLAAAAGPALAPESPFRDRVARRRKRRWEKKRHLARCVTSLEELERVGRIRLHPGTVRALRRKASLDASASQIVPNMLERPSLQSSQPPRAYTVADRRKAATTCPLRAREIRRDPT